MSRARWTYLMAAGFGLLCCAAGNPLFYQPAHFPLPVYDFKNNPPHRQKIELGRVLFYDPILSQDSSISCASCHSPYNAFAHTDHDLSHGIGDQIGDRNAPALFNLAWQKKLMWDGAIHHLDVQALAPLSHPKEMGETLPHVLHKINTQSRYRKLFHQAWGDSLATGEHLLKSLSQFQLTLVSAGSTYDQVKAGKAQFTQQEQNGYQLFLLHCNRCHAEPLFTNGNFANNGLPVDTTLNDWGRQKISTRADDSLLFKIPSLRNLSYSLPYMHDGRFKKIREVLDHYSKGIQESPTLDAKLRGGLLLRSEEKADLTAFLLTLNDTAFVFNPEHGAPPKEK